MTWAIVCVPCCAILCIRREKEEAARFLITHVAAVVALGKALPDAQIRSDRFSEEVPVQWFVEHEGHELDYRKVEASTGSRRITE